MARSRKKRGRSVKRSTVKATLNRPSKRRAPRPVDTSHHPKIVDAIDHLRDLAAAVTVPTITVTSKSPPGRRLIGRDNNWQSPWAIVARFTTRKPITYWVVRRILEAWLTDLESEGSITNRQIGLDRASRINCEWNKGRGDRGEFTLSRGAGPFDATLGESIDRCGDSNEGLIANYEDNAPDIDTIVVWFGDHSYNRTVEVMGHGNSDQ